MSKELSPARQWMLDHPEDVPCPSNRTEARRWRADRGLGTMNRSVARAAAAHQQRVAAAAAKYAAMMLEQAAARDALPTDSMVFKAPVKVTTAIEVYDSRGKLHLKEITGEHWSGNPRGNSMTNDEKLAMLQRAREKIATAKWNAICVWGISEVGQISLLDEDLVETYRQRRLVELDIQLLKLRASEENAA